MRIDWIIKKLVTQCPFPVNGYVIELLRDLLKEEAKVQRAEARARRIKA